MFLLCMFVQHWTENCDGLIEIELTIYLIAIRIQEYCRHSSYVKIRFILLKTHTCMPIEASGLLLFIL